MTKNHPPNDTITFLGTGGARFMIYSQTLATGGLWLNLKGTQFLVDPGPGCIVQTRKQELTPEKLSGIIVSHRHLDHSADVNIMVEAMTQAGCNQHGLLFAPSDALDTDPIILSDLRNLLNGIEVLKTGGKYTIGDVSFTTPVRHIHGVETYGFVFNTDQYSISHITDTYFFDGLSEHYACDLLLLNVVFAKPPDFTGNNTNQLLRNNSVNSGSERIIDKTSLPIDHLSVTDAECLIREIQPKVAILTHFGILMWRANPTTIAKHLTKKTGVRVIAATDGMTFALSELFNN
ncbi:MBL fold metallo-hydrolase [Chloroflexota bacterium]